MIGSPTRARALALGAVAAPLRVSAAIRWANAHPAETAPILAKYMKMDVAVVRAMTRVRQATSLETALMQPVLDVAYRYKQLEKPVEATDIFARI